MTTQRAAEEFFRSALDALSPHVAILDETLRIVEVNRAWTSFAAANGVLDDGVGVGASYAEVLDRAVLAGDPLASRVRAGLEAVLEGTVDLFTVEYPCHAPDEQRWFVLRVTRFICDRGRFLVTAHENVTEEHLALDELSRREALFRGIIETAPEFIAIADEHEHLELMVRAEAGLSPTAVGRMSLADIVAPQELPAIRAHWRRALETGELVQHEVRSRLPHPSGERIFSVRVRRLDLADRAPQILCFATDITEQKLAAAALTTSQERLAHAQKMEAVGQLAGGIAHDFNNILTAIRYHASFALEKVPPEHPVAAELGEVDRAAERGTNLTGQLLAFGRRQTLEPEVLDPLAITADLLPMLRRLVGSRIRIETDFDPTARCIKVDRGQFQQVIANLVLNARDAIASTGAIDIGARRVRAEDGVERVVLTVRDDGAGMSPEVRARVFEPFFTTKPATQGTGLGLAMVHGIVSQSGGAIEVRSEPGRGATFELTFPRVEPASGPALRRPPTPAWGLVRGQVVLVVEDDVILRRAARRSLEAAGFRVLVADDAEAALRMVLDLDRRIDLLLSDVVMPLMTGPDLAKRVRELRPELPVLLVSGYAADAVGEQELLHFEFLAKPFTPSQLIAKVKKMLATTDSPPSG